MADKWMDERDREWRERDWRRSEQYGRGGDEVRRWGEDRSWSGAADDDRGPYESQDRDERDMAEEEYRRRGRAGGRGRPEAYRSGQGGYGGAWPRFGAQDYTGGRGYQDEAFRDREYRQGYGDDRSEYGRGYDPERDWRGRSGWESDGDRTYNRDLERRYAEDMRSRPSGGVGGYDYERGYGDAGRSEQRGRAPWEERREEARGGHRGSEGGDFLQRAGERISSWFRGGREGRDEERRWLREDFGREERPMYVERGHRGMGPKGYKRSDERINEEVHERLTDDPWIDASNIRVEVKGGEVTLSGSVDNREAKHRAERLIEDISGVAHVQNNLRVEHGMSLTGAGRGYGSSALEAEMRRNEAATNPGNLGASGESGRTSTGAEAESSAGAANATPSDPAGRKPR